MAVGAPASTSAFQATGNMEGEGQSHHLPALLEFLHNAYWLSFNHMALLQGRLGNVFKLGAMLP